MAEQLRAARLSNPEPFIESQVDSVCRFREWIPGKSTPANRPVFDPNSLRRMEEPCGLIFLFPQTRRPTNADAHPITAMETKLRF